MSVLYYAVITDELELKMLHPAKWKTHLLRLKGKTVQVTCERRKKIRSLTQNAYYWGVVIRMIADECGYIGKEDEEALHNRLKEMFLPRHGKMAIAKSTSELDTEEFGDYIEKIKVWAANELKIYIPEPGEMEE